MLANFNFLLNQLFFVEFKRNNKIFKNLTEINNYNSLIDVYKIAAYKKPVKDIQINNLNGKNSTIEVKFQEINLKNNFSLIENKNISYIITNNSIIKINPNSSFLSYKYHYQKKYQNV